jgi:hypothetical protein
MRSERSGRQSGRPCAGCKPFGAEIEQVRQDAAERRNYDLNKAAELCLAGCQSWSGAGRRGGEPVGQEGWRAPAAGGGHEDEIASRRRAGPNPGHAPSGGRAREAAELRLDPARAGRAVRTARPSSWSPTRSSG